MFNGQMRWEIQFEIRNLFIRNRKRRRKKSKKADIFEKHLEENKRNQEYLNCKQEVEGIKKEIQGIKIRSKCKCYEEEEKSTKTLLNTKFRSCCSKLNGLI